METYQEMQVRHQREFGEFPCAFAFSDRQFEEALEKLGARGPEDVAYVTAGGFILRENIPAWNEMGERFDRELREAMEDPHFAHGAFLYEMGNHEYHINLQGAWDVCSCFCDCEYEDGKGPGRYLREGGYGEEVVEAFGRAQTDFYRMCDEKGWW